jgi:N-carbamoylputrescine amidase
MSAGTVSVGIVQLGLEPYRQEENRERSAAAAREALGMGAELVVLPELIVPGYGSDADAYAEQAEALAGPTVEAWTEAAAAAGGYVAGGFCEREGNRLFNTAVLVGPEGALLHYRKLHLFGGEKGMFTGGDLGLPVAELPFGVVGLCVCYDLRFVETLRILSLKGADLVCVPTAWVPGFDAERWDSDGMAPQARGAVVQANLDHVYVACASQVGEWGGIEFLGSSIVADPRGKLVLGPLARDADRTEVVELDLAAARDARLRRGDGITPGADRRADVYGLAVDGTTL